VAAGHNIAGKPHAQDHPRRSARHATLTEPVETGWS
jgi:hypothetical protein